MRLLPPDALQNRLPLPHDDVESEAGRDIGLRSTAEALAPLRIAGEFPERRGERRDVAGRQQQAGPLVANDLSRTARAVERNRGHTEGHCLEQRIRQALKERREHEEICTAQPSFRRRDKPKQAYALLQAERANLGLEAAAVVSLTEDYEVPSLVRQARARECLDEKGEAFLTGQAPNGNDNVSRGKDFRWSGIQKHSTNRVGDHVHPLSRDERPCPPRNRFGLNDYRGGARIEPPA